MASSEVGQATIKLTFDTKSLSKSQSEVEAKISAGGSESGSKWGNAWSVAAGNLIAKGIEKVTASIANNIDNAVKRVDTLNNFPKVMQNMGISAEDSSRVINSLSEKLLGLPTTLDAATLAVQRFTSKNGDVEKSERIFLAVNDAILAGGASAEIQSSALEQLSQSYAKGKPDIMEWRTLQQAMPAQLKQISKAMLGNASSIDKYIKKAKEIGASSDVIKQLEAVKDGTGDMATALGEALRNGVISMDEFTDTLIQLDEKGIDGFASLSKQAKDATGGIGTALINLQTAFTKAITDVFQTIGPARISSAVKSISSAIGKIGKVISGVVKLVFSVIDSLASSFSWLGSAFDVVLDILQGIADMFSWLADQKPVVELLKGVAIAVTAIVTAWKAYQFVAGVVQGIQLALNGAMVAGTGASGAYAAGIGAVTKAQQAAATASNGLKAAMGPLGIALLGVVAVMESVNLALETNKLREMEAKVAEKNRMDVVKMATIADNWYNESLEEQKQILKDLEGVKLSAVDAELAYINTQEVLTEKQNAYNAMLAAGTYSAEELHKAQLEMMSAEGQMAEAKTKLANAQGQVNQKVSEYADQEWKKIAAEKQAELLEATKAGRYHEVELALMSLSNSTLKYTDAYGQAMEFTKEDTQDMALFIGDQLAKADGNFKTHWDATKKGFSSVKKDWDKSMDDMVKAADKSKEMNNAGKNIINGLIQGINTFAGGAIGAVTNIASGAISAFKGLFGIHSPSRLMAQFGRYIDEGLAIGISSSAAVPVRAAGTMSEEVASAITGTPTASISIPSITDRSSTIDSLIAGTASSGTSAATSGARIVINNQINNDLDARNISQVVEQAMRRAAI